MGIRVVFGVGAVLLGLAAPWPGHPTRAAAPGEAGESPAAVVRPWTIVDQRGSPYRAHSVQRTRWGPAPGRIEVSATCLLDDDALIRWQVMVFSDYGTRHGYGWHQDEQLLVDNRTWEAFGSVPVGPPWTEITVQFDDERPRSLVVERGEYDNSLSFTTPLSASEVQDRAGVLAVRTLRVGVALDDGSKHFVDLHPSHPSFIAFATECYARLFRHSRQDGPPANPSATPPPGGAPRVPMSSAWPTEPARYDELHAQGAALRAPDGFVFGHATEASKRVFDGGASAFATTLPDLIRRRGLDPRGYAKEIEYVLAGVRLCGGITPAMAAKAPRKEEDGYPYWDLTGLGAEYEVCSIPGKGRNVSKHVGSVDHRNLLLWLTPGHGGWTESPRVLHLIVGFARKEGDQGIGPSFQDAVVAYLVTDAIIRD